VAVYDTDPQAPACRRAEESFNGEWTDEQLLTRFFQHCDVVTYEFENVESKCLHDLEGVKPLMPSASVLATCQDRGREKMFLSDAGLPHVQFAVVSSFNELESTSQSFGYPFILKTARGGYDGKGQFRIENKDDLQRLPFKESASFPRLVLERIIDIKMEVSCIVARSPAGQEVSFPVFENVHCEHILDTTVVPARIPGNLEEAIKDIALRAARKMDVYGLLTTEFFLATAGSADGTGAICGEWSIYINEFAPRPHNSGHVTMKSCTVSQFDLLARVLLGVPLTEPIIVAPGYFCMANLLGDVWLAQGKQELDLTTLAHSANIVDVVLYGKGEPRSKRKMGHLIAYADSAESAITSARSFRAGLSGSPSA
jgi:5-(carboxyamino)imidazole ribonucleotide synthase